MKQSVKLSNLKERFEIDERKEKKIMNWQIEILETPLRLQITGTIIASLFAAGFISGGIGTAVLLTGLGMGKLPAFALTLLISFTGILGLPLFQNYQARRLAEKVVELQEGGY